MTGRRPLLRALAAFAPAATAARAQGGGGGDFPSRAVSVVVAFPPGGCAFLHTHQGPGIRCLIEGGIRINTHGASTAHAPGGAWFEAGPEPVYAQAAADRTWSIAVVRYGRLAASGTVPRGAAPMPVIEAVRATARTIEPEEGPLRGATPAETSAIHRWIDSAPTRIVSCEGGWTLGVDGARTLRDWADLARQAASGAEAEGVRRPRR